MRRGLFGGEHESRPDGPHLNWLAGENGMYVVVGGTGQVGGAVVRTLREKGCGVRAVVRASSKTEALKALGAELFVTDVEDPAHIQIAFEKAEGVFFMTPQFLEVLNPRSANSVAVAAAVNGLQASHVPRVVFLSSIGSENAQGTGLILKTYDMEQALLPLPLPAAAIRAATFMDNLRPLLPHVRESGVWPTPYEHLDEPVEMVAAEDIGKLAAELLTEPWEGKRIIEFGGPEPISVRKAAEVLGKALNRPVEAQTVPKEQRVGMFQQFGMTPGAAEGMAEMMDGFNSGLIAFKGGEGTEFKRGATSLAQWLEGALAYG